jgi:hypothetical protein
MFPGLTNIKTNTQPAPVTAGIGKDNAFSDSPIAQQKLGGNSLTQQLRSVQNWLTSQGTKTYGQGMDVANTGIGGFGTAGDTTSTALDSSRTAMGTTGEALKSLTPAEDYWTKLLSGDSKTTMQAMAPAALQAGSNWANARTATEMGGPRGGFTAALSAGMPQAQTREVNSALYALAPTAATNLNTIANTKNAVAGTQNQVAGTQSNIAGVQGQLANWLASLGIDISKLGLSAVQSGSDSLLGGRGQDVAEHGQAMQLAGQTAQGLEGIVAARMGGK